MTLKIVKSICTTLAHLFPVDYGQYIQSSAWKQKALNAKKRAGWRCQVCGRPQGVIHLDVHHNTYTRLGYEIPEDLVALCHEDCHPAATEVRKRVYSGYKKNRRYGRGYGKLVTR